MTIKNVLIGGGLLITGYGLGSVIGYVKCIRDTANIVEEVFPGTKNYVVKKASDKIIDRIFKEKSIIEES